MRVPARLKMGGFKSYRRFNPNGTPESNTQGVQVWPRSPKINLGLQIPKASGMVLCSELPNREQIADDIIAYLNAMDANK